jgi:hypothetical protein
VRLLLLLQGKGDKAQLSPNKPVATKVTSPQKASQPSLHCAPACTNAIILKSLNSLNSSAWWLLMQPACNRTLELSPHAVQAKASPGTRAAAAMQAVNLGPGDAAASRTDGPAEKPDTLVGGWQPVNGTKRSETVICRPS